MFARSRSVIVLKRALLGGLGLLAFGGLYLAITGVPAPPSLKTDGVPRVSWTSALHAWRGSQPVLASRRFVGWYNNERRMLVAIGPAGNIRVVDSPGAQPAELAGLPDRARGLELSRTAPEPYFVYRLDEGGSELYLLYRYDGVTRASVPLTTKAARISSTVFDRSGRRLAFGSTERNGTDTDLYTLDVTDPPSKKMVYQGAGDFQVKAWSADGSLLVVSRTVSHADSALYVLDPALGSLKQVLAEHTPTIGLPWPEIEVDRKRSTLYLRSDLGGEFTGVHAFEPATGASTPLTPSVSWDVADVQVLSDEKTLALLVNEDARHVLYLLDLTQHTMRRVGRTPTGFLSTIGAHPVLPLLAVGVIGLDSVEGVWTYDYESDRFEPFSVPPAQETLPDPEVIRYATFDTDGGIPRMISAIVLRAAAGFKGPRPVVIEPHGGPALQSLAVPAAGYVGLRELGVTLIQPNVRGSTGYGRKFQELDDGRRRPDAVRDIGALLDWIPTRSDLDAQRVAVVGGSYGGYVALATLAQYSERLRCGFDLFGISDIPTFLEESTKGHFAETQRGEYGDERDPDTRAFLASISPATHAERIRVPLLIFQGANDVRVKPQQSRAMVARIRAAGGQVYYMEAADEGHGLERAPNAVYVISAWISFFERCLIR